VLDTDLLTCPEDHIGRYPGAQDVSRKLVIDEKSSGKSSPLLKDPVTSKSR